MANDARNKVYVVTIECLAQLQRRYAFAIRLDCDVANVKSSVDGGHNIQSVADNVAAQLDADFSGGKPFAD